MKKWQCTQPPPGASERESGLRRMLRLLSASLSHDCNGMACEDSVDVTFEAVLEPRCEAEDESIRSSSSYLFCVSGSFRDTCLSSRAFKAINHFSRALQFLYCYAPSHLCVRYMNVDIWQ